MEIQQGTRVFRDNNLLHKANFQGRLQHNATLKCWRVGALLQHKE